MSDRIVIKTLDDIGTRDHDFPAETTIGIAFDLAEALVKMVDQRDPYTSGHMSRVAWLSVHIGTRLGLDQHRLAGLRLGAELHDLGKSSIPAEILTKPGRLSTHELEIVREHPRKGHDIVSHFSWAWPIPDMLLQHHERNDGSGYPLGIRGQDILEEAKIIAVADVVESMISHRPYRAALPSQRAMEELTEWRGTRYEPTVVDACMALLNDGDFNLPNDAPDFGQTPDRS